MLAMKQLALGNGVTQSFLKLEGNSTNLPVSGVERQLDHDHILLGRFLVMLPLFEIYQLFGPGGVIVGENVGEMIGALHTYINNVSIVGVK